MNNFAIVSKNLNWACDFQTPATPVAEGIISFHHDLMILLSFICCFVLWMLVRTVQLHAYPEISKLPMNRGAYSFNYFKHKGMVLEIVWTIIPAVTLMFVAVPSFALLYSTNAFCEAEATFKIIGHQWYWSYEFNDNSKGLGQEGLALKPLEFDSYMLKQEYTQAYYFPKNLCVDKSLVLPTLVYIKLLITSDDVLHCWTVPSFGVKLDACPGRLNAVTFIINREGLFFGQCSEICGVNHAFMPISVKTVTLSDWLLSRVSRNG